MFPHFTSSQIKNRSELSDDTRCFKVGEIYKTLGTVCHVAFLFNIQANIHLLKLEKEKPVNIRHTAFMEIKKNPYRSLH